jgi:hypothetical protein
MAAVRRDTPRPGGAHTCGPGCPGRGEARSDIQAREGYRHHREQLETQLARMMAARKVYSVAVRPRWWWLCAEEAAPYRADPHRYEDPGDFTASTVPIEAWMRESIRARQVEATGRVRFLARQGLLQPWEELRIHSGGGVRARALAQELERRDRR